MADRQVTRSGKDIDGDITKLCNPGQQWSPRTKADVISDIEKKVHRYYVSLPGYTQVNVHVVSKNGRKYLRTDPDGTKKNNLDDLPDC